MKAIKWTKADERRAKAVGWFIAFTSFKTHCGAFARIRCTLEGSFADDHEAAEEVVEVVAITSIVQRDSRNRPYLNTCRKALLLCALGDQS